MIVNGEKVPKHKAMELIRMLCNDAKELAGQFYELDRSEKFRANWLNAYVYADCNWRHFVEAARQCYATLLSSPHVPEYDKHRMFLAIALYDQVCKVSPSFEGIQLAPGTQQFEGDKHENRKIAETWGKHSNTFRDLLMGSTRYH